MVDELGDEQPGMLGALLLGQRVERSFDFSRHVTRQRDVSICIIESRVLRSQWRDVVELTSKRLRDEVLVHTFTESLRSIR